MRLLYKFGVTLNVEKCKFFAETIDYLRHVIRHARLEFAENTVEAVVKLEHPAFQKELSSYLGVCNIFVRFVPSITKLTAHHNKELRQDQ